MDAFETSKEEEATKPSVVVDDDQTSLLASAKGRSMGEMIAAVLGTVSETYDFGIFGYFSTIIAKVFFPREKGHSALIQTFCIFGSAFVVRPVGSVIFGKIGDTYGRKVALTSSILLMAGATFAIGCLPSYKAIGRTASILLLLVRLLQGISLGGQVTTSAIYSMEGKATNTWGLSSGVVCAAIFCGFLSGSLVGYSIRQSLSRKDLEAWGWRIPFLTGVLLGLPGVYLKCHHDDSNIDRKIRQSKVDDTRSPAEILFSPKHRRAFICAIFITLVSATSFYLLFVWLPIYMKTLIYPPIKEAYLFNSLTGVISIFACLLVGSISDKCFKRTQVMFVGGICLAVFSPFMTVTIGKGEPSPAFFAQVSMAIFFILWFVPMFAWLAQNFPAHVRLSGVSISYNIAFAISGGFAPALATLLVDRFGSTSPGLLISSMSCISMVALLAAPPVEDHRCKSLKIKPSIVLPLKTDYERKELVSYRQVVDS